MGRQPGPWPGYCKGSSSPVLTDRERHTRILLATGNPAKQDALRDLLEGLPLTPVSPVDIDLNADPDETGDTHEAIAIEKAVEWSRLSGMLAIATDGGLVVPALGPNWESRYTHRFAGLAADDDERRSRLLELLSPLTSAAREASWVEALAVADRGRPLKSWELRGGSGFITETEAVGPHPQGFWVFPLWYFPAVGKYYNELTAAEKETLGDHWTTLKGLVRSYFLEEFPRRGTTSHE